MIESVGFRNYKVLYDTVLPLGRFTLIIGPNGSGKSTALKALEASMYQSFNFRDLVTLGYESNDKVEIEVRWSDPFPQAITSVNWSSKKGVSISHRGLREKPLAQDTQAWLQKELSKIRVYSLEQSSLAQPVPIQENIELSKNGGNLAGVIDRIRDGAPERFELLNEDVARWLPEFDRIIFHNKGNKREIGLRTRHGGHEIWAVDLSQGTLISLAVLTLTHLPDPPSMICFEEVDRGIHPRLLRGLHEALRRLSNPEGFGDNRPPVQVVATTHSPYFLDLFKEHTDDVVIAHKDELCARFEKLSDQPNIDEILEDAVLGDAWYSGILGGVPSQP